jgi:hypothetical protein
MATYKVLQDIEAEDRLIGPLTLRQFVYALIAGFSGYMTFLVVTKGAPFLAAIFLPIFLVCLFFAWPWGRDQPTELWALARIRFIVKPRKRIWDQSGAKEMVTVTAPKMVELPQTKGLSQTEVRSRLRTLAGTIDSRGWAIKNANLNMYGPPSAFTNDSSDRLIKPSSFPQQVPTIDIRASDDMLDMQNNPVAQHFDTMMAASAKTHRQSLIDRMQEGAQTQASAASGQPAPNYWFLNEPSQTAGDLPQNAVTFNTQVIAPGSAPDELPVIAADPTPYEESLIKESAAQPIISPNIGHLNVIQPLSAQRPAPVAPAVQPPLPSIAPVVPPQPPSVTPKPNVAILELARNDDLNVATIAREAGKRTGSPQEGVIIFRH